MGLGFSSGHRFREGDLVAERREPLRVVAGEALGIPVVEVVAAEFAVRLAVAQHVVGDDEEAVGDGDDGLLVPAALDQAAVLGGEVGVVFEDGPASAIHEGLAQDAVGKAGTATQAFAGTLVIAGAEAGPGRRMAGSWETRHVAPEFGDDRLRGAAGDAGDGVEPRDRLGVGGGARRDAAIAGRDRRVEELDVAQELVEHEAVMSSDAPGERLGKDRALAPQAPLGQFRSSSGVQAPAISALSIARADTPSTLVTTLPSLMCNAEDA